jgi:hypothetical protein
MWQNGRVGAVGKRVKMGNFLVHVETGGDDRKHFLSKIQKQNESFHP